MYKLKHIHTISFHSKKWSSLVFQKLPSQLLSGTLPHSITTILTSNSIKLLACFCTFIEMEAYTVYSCALCLVLKIQPNSESTERIPVQHPSLYCVSLDKPFNLSLFSSIEVDYNNVYLIELLKGLNEIMYVTGTICDCSCYIVLKL